MSTVRPLYFNSSTGAYVQASATQDAVALAQVVLNGLSGVAADAQNNRIVNVAAPVAATDAVNLQALQNQAAGLTNGHEALVYADSNQTLSGAVTIDGQVIPNGGTVLLGAQTTASQNGLWVVNTSGAWTRPSGYSTGAHAAGTFVYIQEGTSYGLRAYLASVPPSADIIDTANVTFVQISGLGIVSAGFGLAINQNNLSLKLNPTAAALAADSSGLRAVPDNTTLAIASNALTVLGLPLNFTIAGATAANSVTATNLNAVTGGSYADTQHLHAIADTAATCQQVYPGGTGAITAKYPVTITSSGFVAADASDDTLCDVVGLNNQGATAVIYRGLAIGVLSGATAGTSYYLAVGGGLTTTPPSAAGTTVVRIGKAINATNLAVKIERIVKN